MITCIIVGPQGAGKNQIAQQLMRAGQVEGVVEEWRPGQALIEGWAHCTQQEPAPQPSKEARIYITVREDGRVAMHQELGGKKDAIYTLQTVEQALERGIPMALRESLAYVKREAYLREGGG